MRIPSVIGELSRVAQQPPVTWIPALARANRGTIT